MGRSNHGELIFNIGCFFKDYLPLIVDMIFPHDKAVNIIEEKTRMWLNFGVTQVWNVYPDGKWVHTQAAKFCPVLN